MSEQTPPRKERHLQDGELDKVAGGGGIDLNNPIISQVLGQVMKGGSGLPGLPSLPTSAPAAAPAPAARPARPTRRPRGTSSCSSCCSWCTSCTGATRCSWPELAAARPIRGFGASEGLRRGHPQEPSNGCRRTWAVGSATDTRAVAQLG